jgi:hypothetical protein
VRTYALERRVFLLLLHDESDIYPVQPNLNPIQTQPNLNLNLNLYPTQPMPNPILTKPQPNLTSNQIQHNPTQTQPNQPNRLMLHEHHSLPRNHTPDPLKLGHCGELGRVGTWEERIKTASHYTTTAIDDIDKIAVTTLLLHAEDDPVVSSEHIDWQRVESNRNIIVAHTKRGGHCAWHEGLFPFGDTWGDRVTTRFISTVLESHSQTHFIVELVNQAMNVGLMEQQEAEEEAAAASAKSRAMPEALGMNVYSPRPVVDNGGGVQGGDGNMSTRSVPSRFKTPSWAGAGSPAALNTGDNGSVCSTPRVGEGVRGRDRFDSAGSGSAGWEGEPQVQYRPMFQPQRQSLSSRRGLNLSHQLMARITSAADLASMGRPTLAYARGKKVRTSVTDLEGLAAEGGAEK